jgi:hypothetical protein
MDDGRGEAGLTRRLWRPVVVTGAVQALCIAAILLGPALLPMPAFFVALAAWITALLTALWLGVVLFRAGLAHGLRGGARTMGYGVAALAALGVVAVSAQGSRLAKAHMGPVMERMRVNLPITTPIVVADGELVFDGYIENGAARALRAAADRNPEITRIRLGGEGGELREAIWMRDLIAEKGWDTYADGQCWSGCVIAFLGGRHRTIGPGAQMGFHSASTWPISDEAKERAANEQIAGEMIARGVDADFARRAWRKHTGGLWFAPHDEMIRAGLVHEVVKP